MNRTRLTVALVTGLVALVAAGAALAEGPQGKVLYRFVGRLQAAPAGWSLSVSVQAGNRAALRAMLGQSQVQTFTTSDRTEFLRWSNGIPSVVAIGSLAAGETVALNIRAPRDASLADLLATPPGIVGDHGTDPQRPANPLFLFRGRIASSAVGSVTVDVGTGNRRALALLVGQPGRQTFSVGGETVFLLWQGRVPSVIDAAGLKVGDDVVVRVRADRASTLSQVLATPAARVAEHEPKAQEASQTAQS